MASKKKPGSQRDGRVTQAPGSALATAGKFLSDLIGITEPGSPREKEAKVIGRDLITTGPFTLLNHATRKMNQALESKKR